MRAIGVSGRLEVVLDTLHLDRELEALIPLLEKLLPAEDTVRSVRKPKVGRGHLELGLKLSGGSGVNFFWTHAMKPFGFQSWIYVFLEYSVSSLSSPSPPSTTTVTIGFSDKALINWAGETTALPGNVVLTERLFNSISGI